MKTDDTTDDTRVMHIRFGEGNEQRVKETLQALDRGEDPESYFEVVFRDVDELHRVTRPKNLELLRTIARDEPESIRETARLVDRDVRQVHDNLQDLDSLGLIEFKPAGRSKKPVVWYDEISVEVSLLEGDTDADEPTTV